MPRILIIDDDTAVRTTVRMILERSGYETVEAADGREGILMLDGADLVITDVLMPEVDGVDLIGRIRKAASGLPVIAMSGGGKMASQSYLDMAKVLGAYATIAKPFEPEDLLAMVRGALASRTERT